MDSLPASRLFNSIGVCVHSNWPTEAEWNPASASLYVNSVLDLGVMHIRSALGRSKTVLAALKPFFDKGGQICTKVADQNPDLDWNSTKANIDFLAANLPVANIAGFEGANEFNNDYSIDECKAQLPPFVKQMHDYIRGNPKFANVKLVAPSPFVRDPAFCKALANLYGVDVVNMHNYNDGRRPTLSGGKTVPGTLDQAVKDVSLIGPGKPIWVTETGNKVVDADAKPAPGVLSELAVAKYQLRYVFDYLSRGVERMYVYSLRDDEERGGINHGLEAAGTFRRRKAYGALKNLVALFKDSGVATVALAAVVTGPSTLRKMLFRKSGGTFLLVLYLDVDSWDRKACRDINPAPASVKIDLPAVAAMRTYTPTIDASPKQVLTASSITVPVADHVTVLEIKLPL